MTKKLMRMVSTLASLLLAIVQPCLAHEHEMEELGHHWGIRAYAAEMHLQMCVILGLLLMLGVAKVVVARLPREPR